MKVVVNRGNGGFSISKECAEYMKERGCKRAELELLEWLKGGPGREWFGYGYVTGMNGGYERTDILLIEAVETLQERANGDFANLDTVEIPEGIDWYIDNDCGYEYIVEKHRFW